MSITTERAIIHEFDSVELLVNLPDARLFYPEEGEAALHAGDRGVVVSAHDEDQTITVEFFRDGETVAIADVRREQVRQVKEAEDASGAHLEFAFLAEKARFLPKQGGRFNVVGGGITSASLAKTPGTHPNITVVIGISYERHGLGMDHTILVTFRHPDDPRIHVGPVTGGEWEPSRTITHPVFNPHLEPESVLDVIRVPYANPLFSHYGRYEFRITIDGREVKTIYFTVTRPKP